jgi:hypothetical protein
MHFGSDRDDMVFVRVAGSRPLRHGELIVKVASGLI